MAIIKANFGEGGAGLVPRGSRQPSLATALRDVADDLAAIRTGTLEGMDITSADPTAVSAGALGAYTDPPSAGEMASTRTLVNELRTTVMESRTLLLELKGDLNAIVAGTITSADPPAVTGGALGAFTSPPSAGEMAALRALVNELRATAVASRTLAIEIKTDVNSGAAGSIAALKTVKG